MLCHRCGYRGEFFVLKEEGTPTSYNLTLRCPRCFSIFTETIKYKSHVNEEPSSCSECKPDEEEYGG